MIGENRSHEGSKVSNEKYYNRKMFDQYLAMFFIAASSFDKAVLGLSTASLGFTFAFLKLLHHAVVHKCLVIFTWGCFIVSIISILLALICVERYALHGIKYFTYEVLGRANKYHRGHWTNSLMPVLQSISAILFILGLVTFSIFVGINVQ